MARLNEAPIPTESIDALKRRFIRQNRELAKNNSTQSVRIRCLEAEVSRLLTENLTLRKDVLQLRNDLENVPNRHAIVGVQEMMEAKVHELGKLVMELGLMQKPATARRQDVGVRREPSVGWGRGAGDAGDGMDGRLPTIREDKYYPRRTMDTQELRAISDVASESPDLGSPPVAHFQDEDPIKFNPQHENVVAGDPEKDSGDLHANLETRRKRRDTSSKLAIRRMSVFHSPPERIEDEAGSSGKGMNQGLPIRAGAKRKLAAREDDGKADARPGDFMFSRKTSGTSEEPVPSSIETTLKPDTKTKARREASVGIITALPERKALGEKSINTDPVISPKKTSSKVTIKDEKSKSKKPPPLVPKDVPRPKSREDTQQPKPRDRRTRTTVEAIDINLLASASPDVIEVAEITPQSTTMPPKTPAAPPGDIFSPPPLTTEPSAARPLNPRDTPPPTDLPSEANGGRVARRARTSVNYAEPSLNSKMRRPTKELYDAVGKDGRPLSVSGSSNRPIPIKTEAVDEDGWKGLPNALEVGSPLSMKTSSFRITAEIEEAEPVQSASAAAISALIRDSSANSAASKRKIQSTTSSGSMNGVTKPSASSAHSTSATEPARDKQVPTRSTGEEEQKTDSLAIFDFTSSSPPRSLPIAEKGNRSSRRHSSISSLATSTSTNQLAPASSSASSKAQRPEVGRVVSSSSAAKHLRERSVDTGVIGSDDVEGKGVGGGVGRSERAASRRRSMML